MSHCFMQNKKKYLELNTSLPLLFLTKNPSVTLTNLSKGKQARESSENA